MYIVLGGTGRVGSALTRELLDRNERVTVVTHRPDARTELESQGADVAVADVRDADAVRRISAGHPRLSAQSACRPREWHGH